MMYNSSFPRHNTMDDLYTTGFKQIATSLHQMGFDIDATSVELICKGEFLVVKYRWRELDSEEISENEVRNLNLENRSSHQPGVSFTNND